MKEIGKTRSGLQMGYTDSPMPCTMAESMTPSRRQMTLTSRGMIGRAHVGNDEGTSSPRTPQRHRPSRRFTAAPCLDGKGGERGGRGDGYGDGGSGGWSGWFAWMTDGGGQG